MKTLLQGGLLALPGGAERMDLLMEGERITAIGKNLPAGDAEIIGAAGCTVLPGMIDTHTHFDLPVSGTVTADDFASGTAAAVLGGTTVVLDFATQDKGGTLREAYDVWRGRMGEKIYCDVGLHMAVTDWNARTSAELGGMADLGITSYKFYMAYPNLMAEDDAIYEALCRIREEGGIAGFHCENGRLVTALTAEVKARGRLDPAGHALSRPPAVEAEAIARLLRIARLAGAPVNVVHLSSLEGLRAIRETRAPDQKVYIETCPQYLLLADSLLRAADGAKYVCSPPLRGRADQAALWAALKAGEIFTLGTDHCSFNYKGQKEAGKDDFTKIPNGLPGVEHRLCLIMTEGVAKGRVSLSRLTAALSENPARLFGLYPKKGVLAVGSDADLVLWDPALTHVITAKGQAQRVDYTPYEGFEVSGGVRDVWLRGRRVVAAGSLENTARGKYLRRTFPFADKM
ncbi:MAG: dihydropyrimidinase [Firmicutes bacterium]|nr:dihydropyrimidinase [Bacillota bacterium]